MNLSFDDSIPPHLASIVVSTTELIETFLDMKLFCLLLENYFLKITIIIAFQNPVGALNRPRKRKRTNRENPRTIPEQIGKIPEKSGKSQKGQKRTKKEGQVQIGKPPPFQTPPFSGP